MGELTRITFHTVEFGSIILTSDAKQHLDSQHFDPDISVPFFEKEVRKLKGGGGGGGLRDCM